jgi:superfamily II DNA or RNA helicase
LTPEQDQAAATLLKYEIGALAATTAFGKTVVAAKKIAVRDRNTLPAVA